MLVDVRGCPEIPENWLGGWRLKFNTELRFLNRKLDPGKNGKEYTLED